METIQCYTAFAGTKRIARGEIQATLRRCKLQLDSGDSSTLLIFEDSSGRQLDFDLRGSIDEILARLATHPHFAKPQQGKPGPGRPRLGVISREVTLLPRHWEYLERQPKGISATLRALVDEAAQKSPAPGPSRKALEAADTFMWAMAGNLPHCEEASRALYAGDEKQLSKSIRAWPKDLREHLQDLLKSTGRRGSW
jgi:hypothetical protein